MPDLHTALFDALDGAVGVAHPGCVALVWADGAVLYHEAHGVLAEDPASPAAGRFVERDTIYDLASLTKPLATTTLAALALSEGRVGLDAEVPRDLAPLLSSVTFGDLLCHASGLPAHVPFYADLDRTDPPAVAAALRAVAAEAPPRSRVRYSDLGFMLLGLWLERLFERPLDVLFADRVAAPLGLDDPAGPRFVGYLPLDRPLSRSLLDRVAPTERYAGRPADEVPPDYLALRRRYADEAWGAVHDDNAFAMGGVAGHAGLFGTAEGVADLARAWLEATVPGLDPAVRDRLWRPCGIAGAVFRFGFDGPSPGGSTGGALAPDAVGHLGFTGTSLWIEPSRRRIYVLLSNRVHPHRGRAEAIAALRRTFHRIAAGGR